MFKLQNLIISGMEVYSPPQTPSVQALRDLPRPEKSVRRKVSAPSGLLLHTLAVGGLPLPWRRG
ncbi:MAG TPA: hypothetical protein VKB51_10300 [bacterium]|nr:hypothetical protein [bacterium]